MLKKSTKILLIVFLICRSALLAQSRQYNFNFLKSYNGKYPYDVNLLKNPQIKKSLVNLLGKRYGFFIKTWNVETPITIRDGIFTATACMAHNCMDTNFIIVVDIENKKVYAGIRENDKVKTYPAGVDYPQALNDWSKGDQP